MVRAMNTNSDEQLIAESRRWMTGLRNPEVRETCREQMEEWLASGDSEAEHLTAVQRLWRRVLPPKDR